MMPLSKTKLLLGLLAALVLVTGLVALVKYRSAPEVPPPGEESRVSLGFSYLSLTPRLSEYYHLGVDSGALVTEVVPNSVAAGAGVKAGDIILSFNGMPLQAGESLLEMMLSCAGSMAVLEVQRDGTTRLVELRHMR